ncbi:OLC1v1022062C1 [Oldenlandia corymbosa var. corymbosa]|uniref:OLC1v1022062C1 n=1 Tax=Oldenlandia corymbosa var. corymbosa TaxID=529605 RepID=A0AAV1BXN3_OLDCO|nr:OLC1v1022062C1 [Oldenlandia corymbosa var. corymbosa]
MAPCALKMIANKVEIDKLNDSNQPWTAIITVEEKYRLRANIHDESGSIQASTFGSIAEKILGFTATEIVENPEKTGSRWWLSKIVDPAYRLVASGATKILCAFLSTTPSINALSPPPPAIETLAPLVTKANQSTIAASVRQFSTSPSRIKWWSSAHSCGWPKPIKSIPKTRSNSFLPSVEEKSCGAASMILLKKNE